MCPVSLGTSQKSSSARTRQSTHYWLLLVGVNQYRDPSLPNLNYSAVDCQGLSEALKQALSDQSRSQAYDNPSSSEHTVDVEQTDVEQTDVEKTLHLYIHHDHSEQLPQLEQVKQSLEKIIKSAAPQDTVLVYFSGHGFLSEAQQQAVLCLSDTQQSHLSETGLGLQTLLDALSQCRAQQQLVWLDACHSGGMTLRTTQSSTQDTAEDSRNPTSQLVSALQAQAARSTGFYAMLSCDQDQRSWEFSQLGHGVFTFFLMEGLRGAAVNAQGAISADSLYRYVYYQTLEYIDKTNQQLRVINQQKRSKGETQLRSEYPLQTPKRIVEGIGENVLVKVAQSQPPETTRKALFVSTYSNDSNLLSISKILAKAGDFDVAYWPQSDQPWHELKETLAGQLAFSHVTEQTILIYLKGSLKESSIGEPILTLSEGQHLSQSWIKQQIRYGSGQRVIILDCPQSEQMHRWVSELSIGNGVCLLGASSPEKNKAQFVRALAETLDEADLQRGLPLAGWITQLQGRLALTGGVLHFSLADSDIVEILPGQLSARHSQRDTGICPYLGLRAFEETDSAFFFGRETLVQQLLSAVNQRSFLSVVGASGSGKSSVVQAGLVSQLRQGRQIPGSDQWWVQSFRPGRSPIQNLARCLSAQVPSTQPLSTESETPPARRQSQQQIEGLLHLGEEGFVQWLRSRSEPTVVLVVDQFEELFTLASDHEQQQLLSLLLGGLKHASDRFKLIVTLRADFMATGLESPELAPLLQQGSILVPSTLSTADYRDIILRPAEKVGLTVEPELVTVLLQELSQGVGDLPLLEFVLEQIWEKRQPGQLTLQVYQDAVGGLKGALERKAEAVYSALSIKEQDCARWIFLNLTQLGEGTEDTRRRVAKPDLVVNKYPAPLIEQTLTALTRAKLIVVTTPETELAQSRGPDSLTESAAQLENALSEATDEVTVEVAHEILIRHWSTLRWWLDENRTRLRSQRQVEQAALAWKHSQQQDDFLLRGVPLDAAVELYIHHTDELPLDVQQFVEAGMAARNAEQQLTKKRLRRAQQAIALISLLAMGAAGLGGIAYWQRQQSRIREVEALNALATSQLANNQSLDGTVTALQAGSQLGNIRKIWGLAPQLSVLTQQTTGTLQSALSQNTERNRLEDHSQSVGAVVYTAAGQRLASVSIDNTLKIWSDSGRLLQTVTFDNPLSSDAQGLAITPTGEQIAVAHTNGQVTLLTSPPRKNKTQSLYQPLATIDAHNDWVGAVAFSPEGDRLVTASRDGTAKIWTVADQQLIQTLSGHTGWINAVAWFPDGQRLVTGGEDRLIKTWDISSASLLWEQSGHSSRVSSVAVSPSGQQIAVGEGDQIVRLWNERDDETSLRKNRTSQIIGIHTNSASQSPVSINTVAFSPNGQQLLSTGDDRTAQIWAIPQQTSDLAEANAEIADADSSRLDSDFSNLDSIEVDVETTDVPNEVTSVSVEPVAIFRGHSGRVTGAAWHPDSQQIVTASSDSSIRMWDASAAIAASPTPQTENTQITQTQFSPDGRRLAGIGWDGSIQLWQRAPEGQLTPTAELPDQGSYIFQIDMTDDWLAAASEDGTVRLWQLADQTLIHQLAAHEGFATTVALSPDSAELVSGGAQGELKRWDRVTGRSLTSWTAHKDEVSAIAWHPQRAIIASASRDGSITLWSSTGEKIREFPQQTGMITRLAFSPEGHQLAAASLNNTVTLWAIDSGKQQHRLAGHQTGVTDLAYSSDGRVLYSSGNGLRLWNTRTGDFLKRIDSGMPMANGFSLSPSTTELITVDQNGAVEPQLWEISALMKRGCEQIRDYMTNSQSQPKSEVCL